MTDQLRELIDRQAREPFVTAKFGDNWKAHQKRMIEEGQIDIDTIIDIAWLQGRRALLMEEML